MTKLAPEWGHTQRRPETGVLIGLNNMATTSYAYVIRTISFIHINIFHLPCLITRLALNDIYMRGFQLRSLVEPSMTPYGDSSK